MERVVERGCGLDVGQKTVAACVCMPRPGGGRGIHLKRRVLAKLMLLEYFQPASFAQLAELQAAQDGRPRELADAEKALRTPLKQTKKASKKDAPGGASSESEERSALPVWLSDGWAREWLGLEPALATEDLRPYFFFSHDALGTISGAAKRISPRAQELLELPLHPADAMRAQADKRAGEVTEAAIFETLSGELSGGDHGLALARARRRVYGRTPLTGDEFERSSTREPARATRA